MGENLPDETMGNQQAMDIVWLAGIMDGEGSVQLNNNKSWHNPMNYAKKVRLNFPNGDERVILRCVNIIEGFGIRPYVVCLEPGKHQNLKKWQVAVTKMEDAKRLVDLLIPHLTCKQKQGLLLSKYLESRLLNQFETGGKQPDGVHHKCGRRRISAEEAEWARELNELNEPMSTASTTAREGAAAILQDRLLHAKARLQADREKRKRERMDNANTLKRQRRAQRKIQSGLMREHERSAEMTDPSAEALWAGRR